MNELTELWQSIRPLALLTLALTVGVAVLYVVVEWVRNSTWHDLVRTGKVWTLPPDEFVRWLRYVNHSEVDFFRVEARRYDTLHRQAADDERRYRDYLAEADEESLQRVMRGR